MRGGEHSQEPKTLPGYVTTGQVNNFILILIPCDEYRKKLRVPGGEGIMFCEIKYNTKAAKAYQKQARYYPVPA